MSEGERRIAAFEARMAELKQRMEQGLPARADALATVATRLDGGDASALDELRRIAHKLRGVAGTHGHAALSGLAGCVEDAVRGHASNASNASNAALAAQARELERLVRSAGSAAPPAEAAPADAPTPISTLTEVAQEVGDKPRVLIIEDDAATAKLLELTLGRLGGYDVEAAADGKLAFALLLSQRFDVVICDAMMPGVTGPELCKEVRSRPGWLKEMPIIILSAASPEELGLDGVPAGATAWLRKPIRPRKFLNELEAVLASP